MLENDQTLCEVHLALSVGSVGPGKAAEVFMSMFEIEDAMEKLLLYDKNTRLFMELFGILFLCICSSVVFQLYLVYAEVLCPNTILYIYIYRSLVFQPCLVYV